MCNISPNGIQTDTLKMNLETRIKIARVVRQNISLSIVDTVVIVDFET